MTPVTAPNHKPLHPLVGWSAGIVPVVLLIVLTWAWTYDGPDTPAPNTGGAFVRHFMHYGLFKGYGGGWPQNERNGRLPVEQLEPGDLIVCGNPGAVYGEWSHATLYLGGDTVLTQDLLSGIGLGHIDGLAWYDHVRVLRPAVPAATRAAVARTAHRYVGQMFNLMSHPRDPWQWTCSRCVEDAYRTHGIEISDGRFWVTPDALALGSGQRIIER
jgi:NlpC/P60 family